MHAANGFSTSKVKSCSMPQAFLNPLNESKCYVPQTIKFIFATVS